MKRHVLSTYAGTGRAGAASGRADACVGAAGRANAYASLASSHSILTPVSFSRRLFVSGCSHSSATSDNLRTCWYCLDILYNYQRWVTMKRHPDYTQFTTFYVNTTEAITIGLRVRIITLTVSKLCCDDLSGDRQLICFYRSNYVFVWSYDDISLLNYS